MALAEEIIPVLADPTIPDEQVGGLLRERMLRVLRFAEGPAAAELLEAVDLPRGLNASGARTVPTNAPAGFVPARWRGYPR